MIWVRRMQISHYTVGTQYQFDTRLTLHIPVAPHTIRRTEKTKYREMIGLLMYATVMTRPDIAFAVSTLSQHLESLHSTHLKAVT